jgi:hypothetical protein
MKGRPSTIYCVDGRRADVGARAAHLALCHRLRESFGPRVNVIPLPGRADPLGRGGLTTRTIYEINLFGHGVVVCGETDTPDEPGPTLEVDFEALAALEVPLLLYGHVAADADEAGSLAGLPPVALAALASRAVCAVAGDAAAAQVLRSAGAPEVVVGGSPCLFVDRVRADEGGGPAGVLLSVRDPASLPETASGRAEIRDRLRRLVSRLRESGCEDVRLLCQTPADLAFAAAFSELDYAYTEDPYAWLSLLRSARGVLTWRLEPALACAAYGVPFVHLATDPATRRALGAAGLANWTVDVATQADPVDAIIDRWTRAQAETNDRLRTLNAWAELDRLTGAAFGRFASVVALHRTGFTPLPRHDLAGPFMPEPTKAE